MCYAVPLTAAIATSILWKRSKSVKLWWLNLLFYGGAIFGVVDHLWNGELFFISKNVTRDLLLGAVIASTIFLSWLILLLLTKRNFTLNDYLNIK